MSQTNRKLLYNLKKSRFLLPILFFLMMGAFLIVFFLTDYADNVMITRKSLMVAVQGSSEKASDLFLSIPRKYRLVSSQDYLAYRFTSQSVDLRSAFLRNPYNLTYLIQYSDQIQSSQDWALTKNYFNQLAFARFLSEHTSRLANSKNPSEAKAGLFFKAVAKKMVMDVDTNNQLGSLLINKYKAYQKGLPLFQESLKFQPKDIQTYTALGNLYQSIKNSTLSRSYLTLALRLNPTNFPLYTALAQNLIRDEYMEEALTYLRKAVEFLPDNAASAQTLASLLAKAGAPEEGEALLLNCLHQKPTDAEIRYRYALFLKEREELHRAITQLTISLALDPKSDKSYFERANLFIQLELWEKAKSDLQKALQIKPDNQSYLRKMEQLDRIINQATH